MNATAVPGSAVAAPTSLAEVQQLAAHEMRRVDQLIRARLGSDVLLINQVAEHIVGAGGKRLRPLSVLLAAHAAGYRGGSHYQAAAIIEFIHTATLLHDDVVDESDLRRGRSTANALWGNAASVLVGDFLYSRSFQLMVELNDMRIMRLLADTTNRIAEGEVLQLMHLGNPDTDEAAYLAVIERKTAVLFSAATRLGAMLAGLPAEQEALYAGFGHNLGMAFQIADDWLDYVGNADALGKNLGDDLAEGKATLPLIRMLTRVSAAEATRYRELIAAGTIEALPELVSAIHDSGALDYSRERAQAYATRALECLESLPDSPWLQALRVIAEYATQRDH